MDGILVARLPLESVRWLVSSIPVHPTGLSHEDARLTLMQVARIGGFRGRIALTSHSKPETEELLASGADHVFEPFQDAADRAAELVSAEYDAVSGG